MALNTTIGFADNPYGHDYGITCIGQQDTTLFVGANRYNVFFPYSSVDGGLSWQETSVNFSGWWPPCYSLQPVGLITHPTEPNIVYRLRPGAGIDRSNDGRESWTTEVNLSILGTNEWRLYHNRKLIELKETDLSPGPVSAFIDTTSGNVIVAMGHDGVLVRTIDGEWHWVAVGPYDFGNVHQVASVLNLLSAELEIALLLGLLSLVTIVQPLSNRVGCWRASFLIGGWATWANTLLFYPSSKVLTSGTVGVDFLNKDCSGLCLFHCSSDL